MFRYSFLGGSTNNFPTAVKEQQGDGDGKVYIGTRWAILHQRGG